MTPQSPLAAGLQPRGPRGGLKPTAYVCLLSTVTPALSLVAQGQAPIAPAPDLMTQIANTARDLVAKTGVPSASVEQFLVDAVD